MWRLILAMFAIACLHGGQHAAAQTGGSAGQGETRACVRGDVASRVSLARPVRAEADSRILPEGGLVAINLWQAWDRETVYFAFVARLASTETVAGVTKPPNAIEANVLHPAGIDNDGRTSLRVQLPWVRTFDFWPRHRIVIVGCRKGEPAVQFAAMVDVPISAHGTAAAGALLLVALVLLATAAIRRRLTPGLSFARSLDPLVITQDNLGYGSISRLQVLFFSLIVFGLLTYIALRTGVVGDVSADVLTLMGIASAGTAGAAIVGNNGPAATRDASAGGEPQGQQALAPETRRFLAEKRLQPLDRVAQWRDLLVARGEIDIFRVQAVVFSIFVGGTLINSGLDQLAAYEIPDTVLGLLGLSQASYVGGKLVFRRPGQIAEVDAAAEAAREALAAVSGGDLSAEAKQRARETLAALRRSLALLLEETVPQARMDAILSETEAEAKAQLPGRRPA